MSDTISHTSSLELLVTALKTAREEKRLSLEDVSQFTGIQKNYLEQLENGNFSFLSNVYVFACIKTYSKEMGFTESDTLDQCKQELQILQHPGRKSIVKTDSGDKKISRSGDKEARSLPILKSILLVIIGIIIGLLGGVGFSNMGNNTRVASSSLPLKEVRLSVRPAEKSNRTAPQFDSSVESRIQKSSGFSVKPSRRSQPSPAPLDSSLFSVIPSPQP
jgi:cytoskeleton protein RodZ